MPTTFWVNRASWFQLAPLKEILTLKLDSCCDNMELATQGLTWQANTATLKIKG